MSLNYTKFISKRGVGTNVLNRQTAEQVAKVLAEAKAAGELALFIGQEEEISDDKKAFILIDPNDLFSVTVRTLDNVKEAVKIAEEEQRAQAQRQMLAGGRPIQ